MELQRFLELALARTGAAIQVTSDGIDALLAPAVAVGLEVPEEVRLRINGTPLAAQVPAGYGSPFLTRLCELIGSAPRRYRLELEPAAPKPERIQREAEAACAFRNATARIESIEDAVLEYMLVDFHWTAISDERSDGLLTVSTSLPGSSSPRLAAELPSYLERHPEARREWHGSPDSAATPTLEAGLGVALRAASAVARSETSPFVARMRRRLHRDLRHVCDYYDALRDEVQHGRRRSTQAAEAIAAKVKAIEAERKHRGMDLQRRYAVSLRLEPVAVLALRVRGAAVLLRLQRSKSIVTRLLGWNGVARELDRWICALCGGDAPAPSVCEVFHTVCAECPTRCPTCGREACPACPPACRHAS